jgi:hypothetical protein
MATAIQIITRALRLCRVIDASEAVEASDAQDAREALNNMGQRWLASGVLSAWSDATGPTSVLLTPASANDALAYGLAMKLAPEYGVELSMLVLEQARAEIRTLWRDRLTAANVTAGTAEDVILRALRLLPTPANLPDVVAMSATLGTLNAMLAEWYEAGIGLPDYSLSALADAIASDIGDREAIAGQLALRIAPEYGVSVPPEVAVLAEQSMGRLRLRYFQPGATSFAELPARTYTFDIEAG